MDFVSAEETSEEIFATTRAEQRSALFELLSTTTTGITTTTTIVTDAVNPNPRSVFTVFADLGDTSFYGDPKHVFHLPSWWNVWCLIFIVSVLVLVVLVVLSVTYGKNLRLRRLQWGALRGK